MTAVGDRRLRVLVVGPGVIGTVYGAHLAAAGHDVSVLAHGARTDQIARHGFIARDLATGVTVRAAVAVVDDAAADAFELVLVAVWATDATEVDTVLRSLQDDPIVLELGNTLPSNGDVGNAAGARHRGFPGIGGSLRDAIVGYVQIEQQPTTLADGGGPVVAAFEATLKARGFRVVRTRDIAGWLSYHTAFIASIAAALRRCDDDPQLLAANRGMLTLMCRAIEEGFRGLRKQGVDGLPRNLRILHRPLLRPFAVRYWSRTMRSPMGERCFAAHARHARAEMDALARTISERLADVTHTDHLKTLLAPART